MEQEGITEKSLNGPEPDSRELTANYFLMRACNIRILMNYIEPINT